MARKHSKNPHQRKVRSASSSANCFLAGDLCTESRSASDNVGTSRPLHFRLQRFQAMVETLLRALKPRSHLANSFSMFFLVFFMVFLFLLRSRLLAPVCKGPQPQDRMLKRSAEAWGATTHQLQRHGFGTGHTEAGWSAVFK